MLVVAGLRVVERGLDRSALALAGALTWLGTGPGGALMGWISGRIGVRAAVLSGAATIPCGLALSTPPSALEVCLPRASPMLWQRLLVPDTCALRELRGAIQVAMGRQGIHF